MLTIEEQATRQWLLIQLGITTPKEVIEWADEVISLSEHPPAALIELSTANVERTESVISALSALGAGADLWNAFRAALGDAHRFLTKKPNDGERIARRIYGIVAHAGQRVPDEFNGLYHWDDAFYLARENIYGTEEQVFKELMDDLSPYDHAPNL